MSLFGWKLKKSENFTDCHTEKGEVAGDERERALCGAEKDLRTKVIH